MVTESKKTKLVSSLVSHVIHDVHSLCQRFLLFFFSVPILIHAWCAFWGAWYLSQLFLCVEWKIRIKSSILSAYIEGLMEFHNNKIFDGEASSYLLGSFPPRVHSGRQNTPNCYMHHWHLQHNYHHTHMHHRTPTMYYWYMHYRYLPYSVINNNIVYGANNTISRNPTTTSLDQQMHLG